MPQFLFTGDQCFPYDIPVQQPHTHSGSWMNVFLDTEFVCENLVLG